MQKLLFIIIIFVSTSNILYSQDYKSAIGVRAGYSNGISFKTFISSQNALEFLGTNRYGGGALTVMYLIHDRSKNPFDVEDLSFYYGLGGHIGYFDNYRYGVANSYIKKNIFNVGVDCVFGAEYKVPTVPITISLEIKPFIDFIDYIRLLPYDVGIGIRYTF